MLIKDFVTTACVTIGVIGVFPEGVTLVIFNAVPLLVVCRAIVVAESAVLSLIVVVA